MASLLALGGGASEGLDAVLARMLAEQKQAELERSNLAQEDYQNRSLRETSELRRATQADTAASRSAADKDRDASRTLSILNMRPIGQEVSPETYAQETGSGAPADFYNRVPKYADDFQGPTEDPRDAATITFQGTAAQRAAEERAAAAKEMGDIKNELAQAKENRLVQWGPPVVQVGDPNMPGGAGFVTRADAPGKGAPPTGAQRGGISDATTAIETVNRMIQFYKPEFVGPAAGRFNQLKTQLPGVPIPKGFADFQTNAAQIKNVTIKAVTGAAMSDSESARIIAQIPELTDRPEVYDANMRATLQNLKDIVAGKFASPNETLAGAGVPAGGPKRRKFNPATGALE